MSIKNNPVNVALAAYGMSGTIFHAPLIASNKGLRLKKVLERSGTRHSQQRYPEVEVVKDFREILDDDSIELVVVNTPEHTHYDLAKQALLAGKHVVVEKAFTVTSDEAQELIDIAGEQRKVLSVFQNSRFHGDYLTIKQIVQNELLGKLVEFEVHYDRFRNFIRPATWKEEPVGGTGTLYNLGSHIIDQVLQLFGWPQSLFADLRILRPGGKIVDSFELILYYKQLKVILKSSYLVREEGPRYTLHGVNGSFVKFGGDTQEPFLSSGRSPLEDDYGVDPEDQWGVLNTQVGELHFKGRIETFRGSYLAYYDNIYNAIRKGDELLVKPEESMQTIRIIEAAIKSNKEKKIVALKDHLISAE